MQCIIMENTLIKLTLHDETKKRTHDLQIAKATNSDERPRGHRDHFVTSFGGMNCSLAIMSRTSAVCSLHPIILQLLWV